MITDDDILKLSQVFATKSDLDEIHEEMVTKKEHHETFNQVMNGIDKVIKELKTIREEQSIHQAEHESIEKRLTAIEVTPAVAHDLKK